MSRKRCCVPKCEGLGVTLHLFPHPLNESARFAEWVHAIGGDIVGLSNEFIFNNRRVCHHHFEEKYWCRSGRLTNIAVPTLNLPGLTVSKFLSTAPLLQIQKKTSMPSTSKGFAAELSSPFSPSGNTPVIGVDENIGLLAVLKPSLTEPLRQMQNLPSLPSTSKGFTLELSPTLPRSIQVMDVDENKENVDITDQMVKSTNSATGKPAPLLPKSKHYSKHVSARVSTKETRNKKYTPKSAEQKLYKKLLKTRVKVAKLRSKVEKQKTILDKSKKLITNPTFLKAMEDLPTCTRILTRLQFRELKKKSKGRRFTIEEKILALSIYKQSPKAYKFLRKILVLPAHQVLKKLIQKANLKPGVNEKLFLQLKNRAENMQKINKLCILMFDEMAIGANLSYNIRKDQVVGFVNNGSQSNQEYADHAQVFMIRGLMQNYKQAISYSFSASATKGPELCRQIKEIIKEIQKTGLIVVATVCDQGTNNRHAINLLVAEYKAECLRVGNEPTKNIIKINNQKIVPLYDPPHMLKCLRNNLLTKNLIYTSDGKTKCAKWEHLENLMKENPGYKGVRLIPKLTEYHVVPHKIPKMKVKYATEIFSISVAKNMGYLADKGVLPMECKDTADVLIFFDSLFDSVNGSFGKNYHAKPLLGAVRDNTQHHKFWSTAKVVLRSMKFVNRTTNKTERVPTIENWKWTLDNIQTLLKILKKDHKVNSIWMRHLNQDPIENFFGAIRCHGCRDNNPTAEKFESAFATLLINNMSSAHAVGANCEEDLCENLHALIISSNECDKPATTWEFENIPDIEILTLEEKTDPRIMAPLEYISGYFYNQAEKKVFRNCETCKLNLSGSVTPEYIKRREFGGGRWLKTPSHELLFTVSNLQDIIYALLKQSLEKTMLKDFIKTIILMFIDFDFITCQEHKDKVTEFIINIVCRFFIFNYCKNINKILKGKRDCEDDEDAFAVKAKKYYLKCSKRKK